MKRFIVVLLFVTAGVIAQVLDYPGSSGGGSSGGGGGSADSLTNNDTRAIQFQDSLYVVGIFTNANGARFEELVTFTADINQPAGNTASFGDISVRGSATISNQIYYTAHNFNGSNGTSGIALTNNWDMTKNTFKPITNAVGTNLTFTLSNVTASASVITAFKGIGGYSNKVTFLATSGVNIRWMNWQTNGSYDVQTRPGFNYVVQFFANEATNVNAWVSTDDIYVPVSSLFHSASNSAITLLTASNINVRVGQSSSNASVGGVVFTDLTSYTNHSSVGAFTNLARFTNGAHALTNNLAGLRVRGEGRFLTGTNQIQLAVGNVTNAFDSGVVTNLGLKNWILLAQITRSGASSLHIAGEMRWDQGGGVPFSFTNYNLEITETNGIPIPIYLKGQSIRAGGITNNFFQVEYLANSQ